MSSCIKRAPKGAELPPKLPVHRLRVFLRAAVSRLQQCNPLFKQSAAKLRAVDSTPSTNSGRGWSQQRYARSSIWVEFGFGDTACEERISS